MWNGGLGQINATDHRIKLTLNAKPVHQPPYMAISVTHTVIRREIEKMRQAGVVEPAHSEWASPVAILLKKNGSVRFYINYYRLNAITISYAYPIACMEDCLDSLRRATIFSALGCNSEYSQVYIAPEERDKTALISHEYPFWFTLIPVGWNNAPGTFRYDVGILHAAFK